MKLGAKELVADKGYTIDARFWASVSNILCRNQHHHIVYKHSFIS